MRHNHKAVVAAVLAAFAIGFALYSIPPIAEIFMRGWGLDPETLEPSPAPFVVSIVGTFLGAYTLSWLIGRLGIEGGAGAPVSVFCSRRLSRLRSSSRTRCSGGLNRARSRSTRRTRSCRAR